LGFLLLYVDVSDLGMATNDAFYTAIYLEPDTASPLDHPEMAYSLQGRREYYPACVKKSRWDAFADEHDNKTRRLFNGNLHES
jgi:hypothetical protein